MKNAAIATAVLSALASTLATAATVFENDTSTLNIGGRVEFRGDFSDRYDGTMENKSRLRLNIGGETRITDNLTGFGFFEAQQDAGNVIDDDTGKATNESVSGFNQRYLYAGLKGEFGSVSFGRQDTAAILVAGMADMGNHTGTQNKLINGASEQMNNTLVYGVDIHALTVQASILAANKENADGYGIAVQYALPFGLTLGLGYSANDNGKNEGVNNGSATQTVVGAKYSINDFTIAGTYAEGDKDDKDKSRYKGYEIAAEYKLPSNFTVIGAYINQKERADADSSYEKAKDFIELTGRYNFTSNVFTYVTYLNQNKEDSNGKKHDEVRLGLRYNF